MLECDQNTEIAVYDSDHRVASLMYYEGQSNAIHIGRNMHWGTTDTRCWGNLSVNSSTTLGGGLIVKGLTKVTGELQLVLWGGFTPNPGKTKCISDPNW